MSQGHVMPKTIPPSPPSFAQQAQQQYNHHLAQQAMNASPSAMLQNAAFNVGLSGMLGQQRMKVTHRYMIDGISMDFDDFINTLYPEDCAEKTFMILKLKKE